MRLRTIRLCCGKRCKHRRSIRICRGRGRNRRHTIRLWCGKWCTRRRSIRLCIGRGRSRLGKRCRRRRSIRPVIGRGRSRSCRWSAVYMRRLRCVVINICRRSGFRTCDW